MIVLLADDEPMVLKIATRLLEFCKHEVVPATDGAAAVELLRSRDDIDIAILDQSMPKMTGVEALAELRSFRPDLPVLISSGNTLLEFDDPLVLQLQKPYRIEALEEALANFTK
jgi:two-component system KDP operon response regulator KdpE